MMSEGTVVLDSKHIIEELSEIDPFNIPRHVAIIPDGNRRWAKKNHVSNYRGHRQGIENFLTIVEAAKNLGVKVLTFYTFSTENWSRSKLEIKGLMYLLKFYLALKLPTLLENNIRFKTIGDLSKVPSDVQKKIKEITDATAHCQEMDLILAINYGGRDEIKRAFTKMLDDYEKKQFNKEEVSEKLISSYLDTKYWSDPDLVIRTSGEYRVSNFLLWQISYSEVYVSDTYWPEFKPSHLKEAMIAFQKRKRRMGGQ